MVWSSKTLAICHFSQFGGLLSSQPEASHSPRVSSSGAVSASANLRPSKEELYIKLNRCKIKAVALSLISPFANQFVDQSRSVPVVSELFHTENLSLGYTELLRKCIEVQMIKLF